MTWTANTSYVKITDDYSHPWIYHADVQMETSLYPWSLLPTETLLNSMVILPPDTIFREVFYFATKNHICVKFKLAVCWNPSTLLILWTNNHAVINDVIYPWFSPIYEKCSTRHYPIWHHIEFSHYTFLYKVLTALWNYLNVPNIPTNWHHFISQNIPTTGKHVLTEPYCHFGTVDGIRDPNWQRKYIYNTSMLTYWHPESVQFWRGSWCLRPDRQKSLS